MKITNATQRCVFCTIPITFLFILYYCKISFNQKPQSIPRPKWHSLQSNGSQLEQSVPRQSNQHFTSQPPQQPTSQQQHHCKRPLNLTTKYPFQDILLAINFNHPYYDNVEILLSFYQPLFPKIVICGPEASASVKHNIIVVEQRNEYGYYGFQCLVEAIRQNPGYSGYLYVNDDVIFNWWNLYKADRSKIWFPIVGVADRDMVLPPKTFFWQRASTLERCIKVYNSMEKDLKFINMKAIEIYMENVKHKRVCVAGLSDIVYMPGRLAEKFKEIGQKCYDNRLFLEVSVPMSLLMIEKRANIVNLDGIYLQLKYKNWGPWTGNTRRAWSNYNYGIHFLHPYKLSGENRAKNTHEFEERILRMSNAILQNSCLDSLDVGRFWAKN